MSPASRSKSKDKRAGKEPPKAAPKLPSANAGGGIPTSGYNPLSGTFHTLRNIDETDVAEYDSVSNNDSWSGESEDHHKDKILNGTSLVPDHDKREKIRQKNEKKHQRQKERRAQELHEKCTGYLMSRKLEALAQQLVAMGFSSERATMALIVNEGKLEESVSWLFEGVEEAFKKPKERGNLKIDISEELGRIADMEIKYKCSKQEVERAVVACEGDLDKTDETLRSQKQEPKSMLPKPEETRDPPTRAPSAASTIPSKSDERDFNYIESSNKIGGTKLLQVDKRLPNPIRTETRYGIEVKNLHLGTLREPFIVSSSQLEHTAGWYNTAKTVKPNGPMPSSTNQLYSQLHYRPHRRTQQLAAATSLGLFSGLGTNGSTAHIDWNSGCGGMLQQVDYSNIDWSLDCASLPSRRGGGMWPVNSFNNSYNSADSFTKKAVHGFEDGVGKVDKYGGSMEWTSPFEERDLFTLPRQFVSAPSL